MITPTLTTDRLILRKISSCDIDVIFNTWMNDNEVSKYMWWSASDDINDTKRFVEFELSKINDPLWKRWIIELKDTHEVIGTCLVFYNDDDNPAHFDISYNLGRKYYGHGYTTEAMKCVMDYAVKNMGLKTCITTYASINEASANVLKKLGFKKIGTMDYECSGGRIITPGVIVEYIKEEK